MQKKIRHVDSLQEDAKTYDSLFTLVVRVIELETTLAVEEKWHQDAFDVVIEMTHHAQEEQKIIQWEVKAHVKALKTFKDGLASLKVTLHDSL